MPGRLTPPMPDSDGAAMGDQRIDQRAVGMAGRGMDDETRRLVDDDEMLVLEHDVERDVLAGDVGLVRRRRVERRPRRRRRVCARVARRPAVDAHAPASISAFSRVRENRPRGRRARKRSSRSPAASAPTSNDSAASRRLAARAVGARRGRGLRAAARPAAPSAATIALHVGRSPASARRARGASRRHGRACCRSSRRRSARPASIASRGIIGHQLRRAGIMDMRAMPLRHAGIGLGDDRRVRAALRHAEHRDQEIGGADAAIRAEGQRRDLEARRTSRRKASGLRPIMVRPAVSKLAVAA